MYQHRLIASVRLPLLLFLAAAAARCINGSPPLPAAPTPTVTAVAVTGLGGTANPGQTAQLTAIATYSDGTTGTVTEQATWSSQDSTVATVSPAGVVTYVATGETDIRATFQSVTGSAHVTVNTAPVIRHLLTGRVTDADSGRGLENARVEVLDGPDAGRVTSTNVEGNYTLSNLAEGTFNMRLSYPTFDAAQRVVTLTGATRLDVALRPTVDAAAAYGTYNISLRVVHQVCSTPVVPAPTGQLRLTGNPDGTRLTVTIVERGTAREYGNGRLRADGSFSAVGGGLIPGLSGGRSVGPGDVNRHDFTGSISGRVSGGRVEGAENMTYGAPCPGGTLNIAFDGSK